MATIITDLKESFRRGNIYIQLIYINVGSVSRTRIISAFCFVRWDISPMCGRRYSCLFWGGRAFRAGVMRWF